MESATLPDDLSNAGGEYMHTVLKLIDKNVPTCKDNHNGKEVNCYPTVVESDFIEGIYSSKLHTFVSFNKTYVNDFKLHIY